MKNNRTKTVIIAVLAVLVLTLGAAAVLAQDDAEPDTPTAPLLPFGRGGYHGGFRGEHHGFYGRDFGASNEEALAEALGITVEELQAARQKAAAERIAQAVEDGYLTRDQANLMLAHQALMAYIDHEAIMAQALGLTVEEFEAAREAGTLRDLLGDVDMTDLHDKMQAAMQAAVQQAVDENVISEEQAALVLEQLGNDWGMHGRFGGGHHGFGRGRGGFHHFQGVPQDDADGEAFMPFHTFRGISAFDA
jgi:hypothetical protein